MNQKSRVLIVDDMAVNLRIMESMLESEGISSDLATDGQAAFEQCKENDYDLIFMDQSMPGIEGTETIVYIKRLLSQKNINTPIICYTSNDSPEEMNAYKKAGFADILTKPLEKEELDIILKRYLN